MRIKDITILGMLSALLLGVQVGLAFLPNIELVTLLIIVYTIFFGKRTLYIISVFILLEGLLYGFGLWWINYLYIWFLLYFIVLFFRKHQSPIFWALLSGSYGLAFGALCAIPYLFIGSVGGSLKGGIHMAFAWWVSGIPFDIPHGISNFILTLILFTPLSSIIKLLYKRQSDISK